MAVSLLIHRRGGGGFKICFIFTSIWGNDPILISIFQMGWNHQLVGVANYLLTHPATVTSIIAAWCASEKATFFDPKKTPISVDKMTLLSGGEGCVLLGLIIANLKKCCFTTYVDIYLFIHIYTYIYIYIKYIAKTFFDLIVRGFVNVSPTSNVQNLNVWKT